ncbi:cadherin-like domain-containing protein [Antarctobacter sp.]|uniref:cadherin-like domain-containing protein n=1 Tax=Antarctobacter sp. TaxID=1872577 RepID=UPI002B277884|nr:cadherin-like domain-containing protein [Antarctobacter sp.]
MAGKAFGKTKTVGRPVTGNDDDNEIDTSTDTDSTKINGGDGNDDIVGTDAEDRVNAGDGNDTVNGGIGDDILFGNDGDDTAVFSGSILDYTWEWAKGNTLNVSGADGNDQLKHFEHFQFDDFNYSTKGDNAPIAVLRSSATTEENTALTLSGDMYDFDGDEVSVVGVSSSRGSVSAAEGLAAGQFAVMGSSEGLEIAFDPLTDFDYLAFGESTVETVTLIVEDSNGNQTTTTFDITITGTNDAPVIETSTLTGAVTEIADGAAGENADTLTTTGAVNFSDVDVTDTHTASFVPNGADYRGTFSILAPTSTDATTTGAVDWTFDIADAAIDDLAAGQVLIQSYAVNIDDGNGGTATETVTVKITGTNDAPEVSAIDAGSVTEDDALVVIDLLAGQTDVDNGAVLTADAIVVTDDTGAAVTYTDNGDGTISVDPYQYDDLDTGESRIVTVSYDVSDGFVGVANTATLSVTGVTDNLPPVANDDVVMGSVVGEFLVNEQTYSSQNAASITTLTDGCFVVTWTSFDGADDTSGTGVKARIFDSNGVEIVGEFLVNELTDNNQFNPTVTALKDGRFIVTWESRIDPLDPSGGIKARIFNADGTPAGSEFLVNERINSFQFDADVVALEDGNFIVSWVSNDGVEDSAASGIKARIFDADGNEVVSEFPINNITTGAQHDPSLVALPGGGFIVTWYSGDGVDDTSRTGIKARIFDADGVEVVSEFLVNDETFDRQASPRVTALEDGRLVVTWYSNDGVDDTSFNGIKAKILNADGTEAVSEFLVNENIIVNQWYPDVVALADGGFVVTWASGARSGGDGYGFAIKARVYNADGTAVSQEFLVNEEGFGFQEYPVVTALPNGGFVVSWQTEDGVDDPSSTGVKARIFKADGTPADGSVTDENTAYTIDSADLLGNDTDPDGDPLTISAVSATSDLGATVTLNPDGSVTYDPTTSATLEALDDGEILQDTFTYTISDGNGGTDTATVTMTVSGVSAVPVTVDFSGSMNTSAGSGGEIYSEDGFVFRHSSDGDHVDQIGELTWHDDGGNPGDNDLIVTRSDGGSFNLDTLDILADSGFQIKDGDGNVLFDANGTGTDVAVNITDVEILIFESDGNLSRVDNLDFEIF